MVVERLSYDKFDSELQDFGKKHCPNADLVKSMDMNYKLIFSARYLDKNYIKDSYGKAEGFL